MAVLSTLLSAFFSEVFGPIKNLLKKKFFLHPFLVLKSSQREKLYSHTVFFTVCKPQQVQHNSLQI